MIVVDANVTAYLMLMGDMTPLAQEVYRLDSDWLVPPVWEHEFVNILATYAKRDQKELDRYKFILKQTMPLVQGCTEYLDMNLVLELVVRYQLSTYDAEYVYLAKIRPLPLVTEDKRLQRAMPDIAMSMADYIKNVNES
jgi:predicted nucleic acid-binding protein